VNAICGLPARARLAFFNRDFIFAENESGPHPAANCTLQVSLQFARLRRETAPAQTAFRKIRYRIIRRRVTKKK
jgi:hypothetical protein